MKQLLFAFILSSSLISCGNNSNPLVEGNVDLTGIETWKSLENGKIIKDVGETLNERTLASVEITEKNVDVLTDYYLEYKVQKKDTLMLIAFKVYGDYRMWKDIKDWNEKVVLGNYIKAGTIIYYRPAENKFNLPKGKPYLISKNESLSKISKKVYAKANFWPFLYENNKRVIRDPSLIFPGFTLFYRDKEKYHGRSPRSVDTRPIHVKEAESVALH